MLKLRFVDSILKIIPAWNILKSCNIKCWFMTLLSFLFTALSKWVVDLKINFLPFGYEPFFPWSITSMVVKKVLQRSNISIRGSSCWSLWSCPCGTVQLNWVQRLMQKTSCLRLFSFFYTNLPVWISQWISPQLKLKKKIRVSWGKGWPESTKLH